MYGKRIGIIFATFSVVEGLFTMVNSLFTQHHLKRNVSPGTIDSVQNQMYYYSSSKIKFVCIQMCTKINVNDNR